MKNKLNPIFANSISEGKEFSRRKQMLEGEGAL